MKSLAVITAAVLTLFQSSAFVRADAGSGMKDSGIDYTEADCHFVFKTSSLRRIISRILILPSLLISSSEDDAVSVPFI